MKKYIAGGIVLLALAGFLVFMNRDSSATVVTTPITSTDTGQTSTDSSGSTPPSGGTTSAGGLTDGTYDGSAADAVYGTVQVEAVVSGGKLTAITFLQSPNAPGHTTEVNQEALPQLVQEAIAAQSSQVDTVSGATQTSEAFTQSLQVALASAQA